MIHEYSPIRSSRCSPNRLCTAATTGLVGQYAKKTFNIEKRGKRLIITDKFRIFVG